MIQQINQIKSVLSGSNPNAVAQQMVANNPQFAKFANDCKGKSIEEICKQYGLNYDDVKQLLK